METIDSGSSAVHKLISPAYSNKLHRSQVLNAVTGKQTRGPLVCLPFIVSSVTTHVFAYLIVKCYPFFFAKLNHNSNTSQTSTEPFSGKHFGLLQTAIIWNDMSCNFKLHCVALLPYCNVL